jgi:hypothetical protein
MKTTHFSSSSSSDRRIGALLRHLNSGSDSDNLSSLYASPTSGGTGGSVFSHLVQAPEDPILGVPSSSSIMFCVSISFSNILDDTFGYVYHTHWIRY